MAPGAPATHTKSRFRPSPGPSCVGGPCVQRPVFAGFSAIFSVCALAQLYLKTLCVFFLSPLPRGVRGGSGLFVYQGNLLFWAESGPTGKARESLFEVWPRAGRPRNVFWESGPGPAATEPGFCQNGAAASADTFLIKNVFCFAADQLKFALHPCESPRDACRRPRPVGWWRAWLWEKVVLRYTYSSLHRRQGATETIAWGCCRFPLTHPFLPQPGVGLRNHFGVAPQLGDSGGEPPMGPKGPHPTSTYATLLPSKLCNFGMCRNGRLGDSQLM